MADGESTIDLSRYSSLGDFRLDVEAEKEEEHERDEGEEGEDGSLLFCFWVFLLKSATFPCTIFRQVNSDVKDGFPILVLNGDKRLTLLPPLPPQKEYPDSEVSPFSSEKLYASSDSEFPFGKWVHVGCQVSSELLRLHIDGEVADEKPLSASKDGESSPLRKISLVSTSGTDDGIEGYLYSPKVLHPSSSIEDHYKDSPVHLAIDKSSASDIEEVSDGIWSIVGGKAKDSFRTCPDVILKNIETAEKLFSDSECTKMRNSNSKSMPSVGKAVPDSFTFSYCLAGPHERALLLKKFAASASDEEVLELANQVSLCTGCSHHLLPPHTIHIRPLMIKVEKDLKLSDIRTVDALEIVQTRVPNEFLLDMVENALGDANSVFSSKRAAPRETNSKTRPFFGGVGVNRDILVVDLDDDNHVSSPNSTVSSISGKRSERDPHGENEVEAERTSCSCESIEEDGSGGDGARKKLRLSREQSLVLEETFKEHNTLNPKQKLALAKQLNLSPRQVEVWFQNRRARSKMKQTKVDCEYLKRCCDNLTQENKRLQKEVQELRALKLSPQLYMHMNPPTTLTMCPSCQRVCSFSIIVTSIFIFSHCLSDWPHKAGP